MIVDAQGTELVRVRDFAGRVLTGPAEPGPDVQRLTAEEGADGPLFYEFDWSPRDVPGPTGQEQHAPGTLLVLSMEPEPVRLLARSGRWPRVVRVAVGERFHADGPDDYTIDPLDTEHHRRLLAAVADGGVRPGLDVVHLWDLPGSPGPADESAGELAGELARLDAAFDTGLFAVLHLLQAAQDSHGAVRLLHAHAGPAGSVRPEQEALPGLARAAESGPPRLWFRAVRYDGAAPAAERLARTVLDEFAAPAGSAPRTAEIRYGEDGRRLMRVVRPAHTQAPTQGAGLPGVPLRKGGVYLITGGTGGIGLVFARYLAERHQARLVLLARSPLGEAARAEVERLTALGAELLAVRGDVAVPGDVRRALGEAKERFGRLDGVFHAAGTYDPTPLPGTDRERFERVLAAKTHGTVNLDVLTKDERLDLFVLFSSVSTVLGDFGAGSYAAANRYLDAYAVRRDQRVREGRRHGRTLSLDWPLWSVGGVDSSLGEAELRRYQAATGMRLVTADEGLEMFERAWAHGAPFSSRPSATAPRSNARSAPRVRPLPIRSRLRPSSAPRTSGCGHGWYSTSGRGSPRC